jgi:hypothetical protein
MKCEKYLNLIDDLIEGELDEPASQQVNLHVFACAECASHFESLKREKEIFAHYLFDVEPANDLWAKFQTKLETETVKTPLPSKLFAGINNWKENLFGFLRLSPALVCAALILTLGIGFVLFNFSAKENFQQNSYSAKTDVQPQLEEIGKLETTNSEQKAESNKNKDFAKNARGVNKLSKAKSKTEINIKTVAIKETKIEKKAVSKTPEINLVETTQAKEEQSQIKQIAALEMEAAKQVEKIELLLRSFRNARSGEGDENYDVAYEKEQARKLLEKNVLLRRNAENYGSLYTEEILSRVEPYLLDISNLESKPAAEKVREIKERVKNQNIIASLQIY